MNWLAKLKSGLSKTSSNLTTGITSLFTKRKLDKAALEELEELLIASDMGAGTSHKIIQAFSRQRLDKEIAVEEIKTALASEIEQLLIPVAKPLTIDTTKKPYVIIMVGVNGNGKTTTIGKMAVLLKQQGYSLLLAAADTFRAAAVEQLAVWAKRNACEMVTGVHNADPASVAYQAYEKAKAEQKDVLIIDTAGRLHNKANLMAELQKIVKVIQKIDPEAPHSVIQVLDATTGQNAINQVEVFASAIKVNGLVITKLDGTAKGGIVVSLADKFHIPLHYIGVGESIEDLQHFDAKDFSRNLFSL